MATITRTAQITPFLWYDGKAEEAVDFYTGIFPGARKLDAMRSTGAGPWPEGAVVTIGFEMGGAHYTAFNGGPGFPFTQAISLVVHCADQAEIDYYWEKLSAGGTEIQCGWLKDPFGLHWQIIPANIFDLIKHPKAMEAMMHMVKLDIAVLEEAAKS
ncbi:MAG TPA: VOC family protein [Terracidiphilus sp.]|jgi:predicted 3-demethylubiquinone-9 3-methyltransferase (glyoxalase superfamily)|nr:VOC family protein [Terracidiphilus sp.]